MDVDESKDQVGEFLSKLSSGSQVFPTGSKVNKEKAPPTTTIPSITSNLQQSQPSTLFSDRKEINKIDSQYNSHLQLGTKDHDISKITYQLIQPPIQKYRYMFEKIRNKSEVLDDRIDYIAEVIAEHYELEEGYSNPNRTTQELVTAVGRICCDATDGKLNSKSIMLESSRTLGMGKRIPLDISNIKDYSLFPGQIVAVQGANITGKSFKVEQFILPPIPPSFNEQYVEDKMDEDQPIDNTQITDIIFSAGPYTLDNDLSFQPLEELITLCQNEKPNALILLGPFVSATHPLIMNGEIDELPDDIFKNHIATKLNKLLQIQPNLQLIILPHPDDIIHDYPLYPQPCLPAIDLNLSNKIHSLGNPSMIRINGTDIAIANMDVLLSLGQQEISKTSSDGSKDRLATLSRHLLQQQNFYPLFPTSKNDSIDADQMVNLQLSIRPDILILPSQLRHFTKLVDDVLCINPGHLCKRQSGGTYARLTIHPKSSNDNNNAVHERTRVDLVKL
ncbi:unnamed protein product [Cunninghamella echinulata]